MLQTENGDDFEVTIYWVLMSATIFKVFEIRLQHFSLLTHIKVQRPLRSRVVQQSLQQL